MSHVERVAVTTLDEDEADIGQRLSGPIEEAQEAIRLSARNLPPLAQHVQRHYQDSISVTANRAAAFTQSKIYAVQALASVAYQIQQLSAQVNDLLDVQFSAASKLVEQLRVPKQMVALHEEQLARRAVSHVAKRTPRTRTAKLSKPEQDQQARPYVRQPLDFDSLDDVGHGDSSRKLSARGDASEKRYTAPAIRVPPAAPLKTSAKAPLAHKPVATPRHVVPPVAPPNFTPPTAPGYLSASATSPPPAAPAAHSGAPPPPPPPNFSASVGSPAKSGSAPPPPPGPAPVMAANSPPPPPPPPMPTVAPASAAGIPPPPPPPPAAGVPSPPPPPPLANMTTPPPPPPPTAVASHSEGSTEESSPAATPAPTPAPAPVAAPRPAPAMNFSDQLAKRLEARRASSGELAPVESKVTPLYPATPVIAEKTEERTETPPPPPPAAQTSPPQAPAPPVQPAYTVLSRATALFDYDAHEIDELSFKEGEVIEVTGKNPDDWWYGVIADRKGIFPSNYVEE